MSRFRGVNCVLLVREIWIGDLPENYLVALFSAAFRDGDGTVQGTCVHTQDRLSNRSSLAFLNVYLFIPDYKI